MKNVEEEAQHIYTSSSEKKSGENYSPTHEFSSLKLDESSSAESSDPS
jgi:hypothetical protein